MKYKIEDLPTSLFVITINDGYDDEIVWGVCISKKSALAHLRYLENSPYKEKNVWYGLEEVPLHGDPFQDDSRDEKEYAK